MNKNMSLVVATDKNGGIGKDNAIPWKCSGDLKNFRDLTGTGALIMGRNTFESIGSPLPNRQNIVLTSGGDIEGVQVAKSVDEALSLAEEDRQVWIIGGEQVYSETAKDCEYIVQTEIQGEYECDTFFEIPDCFMLAAVSNLNEANGTDPAWQVRIFVNELSIL